MLQLKTGRIEDEDVVRPPIELAIVLDKSGSMSGKNLANSKVAIKQVIENLSIVDRVHFVTYSSTVETIFEAGDLSKKADIYALVDAVEATGCTNMEIGINQAVEILKKSQFQDGRSKRIFLFSDGLVNEGIKTHAGIFELIDRATADGISTATFGLGTSFDEDLMKGISEHGRSDYFFIENVNQIERFVTAALGALLRRIGSNAILKIRGLNGGIVEKIFNGDLIKGYFIGDIKQENVQSIIAELKITPTPGMDVEEVMTYSLVFDHQPDGAPIKIEGKLSLQHTEDDALLLAQHPDVEIAHEIQKTADQDLVINDLIEKDQMDEAKRLKRQELERYRELRLTDTTGRIDSLIAKSEAFLSSMEDSKKSKLAHLKEAKYQAKMKKFDSADWYKL